MKRKSEVLLCEATVKSKEGSQLQLWDLPKDILRDIISRLSLRDAIRTNILSNHWKYVWCDHTKLTFSRYTLKRDCDNPSPYGCRPIDEQEFIARVDSVLQQHRGTGVDCMEIRRVFHNKHADHLDRWVKFAIVSKTKELILHLTERTWSSLSSNMQLELPADAAEPYNFPCHLFCATNGSYMQALQLISVSLNLPPDFSGFLNLQRLNMVDVNITEERVEYLLSRCTLLEFLEISCCRNLTSICVHLPMSRLKHLQVEHCTSLKRIEMNCGLTTLKYSGPVVPLEFATTSRLRSVRINKLSFDTALDYITTGFPSTLPYLETLYLKCAERERPILPLRSVQYNYLRQLRLELTIFGNKARKTDVLDYAYLLDAAHFIEELELHMWMDCHHQPYHPAGHGELRSLPSQSHQHTHLKSVYITGFFGHKDQVELALHILRRSVVLKEMKIDPRVTIMPGGRYAAPATYKLHNYMDGYLVAAKYIRGTYHGNIVEVLGVSPTMARELTRNGRMILHTGCWD